MFYGELEPFDETRADLRTADIVKTIVNMNRDRNAHPTPFHLYDLMLVFGDAVRPKAPEPPEVVQPWQQQLMIARLIAGATEGQ